MDDVNESIQYWQYALIGTVIGAKIHVHAMKRFVASRWSLTHQIHMADSGIFVFRFDSTEDQVDVLGGGPWMINGSFPLVLKKWTPRISLDPCTLVDYPVWIKLPGLDLQFWSPLMLGKIASLIGKPCCIDKLTVQKIG